MSIIEFFNCYCYFATGLCLLGLSDKFIGLLYYKWPVYADSSVRLIGAPRKKSFGFIAKKILYNPASHFHYKSSRLWTFGYITYHSAILLVVGSYLFSVIVIFQNKFHGLPLPDFLKHVTSGSGYSISNVAVFIFGNAEPFASRFLYGDYSWIFNAIAWIDLPLALTGNLSLLYVVISRRSGATCHDLDHAACDLRIKGVFSGQRLVIRIIILSIIITEFLGRFESISYIAYFHAFLGFSLIAVFPFTYLVHVPFIPFIECFAFIRRRRNAIA